MDRVYTPPPSQSTSSHIHPSKLNPTSPAFFSYHSAPAESHFIPFYSNPYQQPPMPHYFQQLQPQHPPSHHPQQHQQPAYWASPPPPTLHPLPAQPQPQPAPQLLSAINLTPSTFNLSNNSIPPPSSSPAERRTTFLRLHPPDPRDAPALEFAHYLVVRRGVTLPVRAANPAPTVVDTPPPAATRTEESQIVEESGPVVSQSEEIVTDEKSEEVAPVIDEEPSHDQDGVAQAEVVEEEKNVVAAELPSTPIAQADEVVAAADHQPSKADEPSSPDDAFEKEEEDTTSSPSLSSATPTATTLPSSVTSPAPSVLSDAVLPTPSIPDESSSSPVKEATDGDAAAAETSPPKTPTLASTPTLPITPSTPATPATAVKKSWADLVRAPASATSPSLNGIPTSTLPSVSPPSGVIYSTGSTSSNAPADKKASPAASSSSTIIPRGLVNNGNLCFANAVLQVLVWTSSFRQVMKVWKDENKGDLKEGRVVDAMVEFLQSFLTPPPPPAKPSKNSNWPPPYHPSSVYASLSSNARFDGMRNGTQEDAEEFLGFFLETIGEEMTKAKNGGVLANGNSDGTEEWKEVGSKGKTANTRTTEASETPLSAIFGGKLRSVVKCPGHKDSITVEPYQRLQLDIQPQNIHTIEDAIHALTVSESLSDYVPKTKGPIVPGATKSVQLDSHPKVLILHLKRFVYDATGGVQKFGKTIRFGEELLIKDEWCPPSKRSPSTPKGGRKYQLYAVVYHHGRHATGGHYTVAVRPDVPVALPSQAGARPTPSKWVHIDDTAIWPMAQSDLVCGGDELGKDDRGAYLLCYKLV